MCNDPEKYYAEFLERVEIYPEFQKKVKTWASAQARSKAKPENMRRDPKMCRRAAKKRWAAVKAKRKQEERGGDV